MSLSNHKSTASAEVLQEMPMSDGEILNYLPHGVLIFDRLSGAATAWNDEARRVLYLGTTPLPYVFPSNFLSGAFAPASVQKRALALENSKVFITELRIRLAGEGMVEYEAHWQRPLQHPSQILVVLQKLRVLPTAPPKGPFSAEHLQRILESVPVAVVASTLEGVTTYWNQSAERIYGWSSVEVLGRPSPFADGDGELMRRLRRTVIDRQGFSLALTRRRKNGTPAEVRLTVGPWVDELGEIRGFLEMAEDISEVVGQERVLEQTRKEVLQLQKMDAVGRLAGGMAHDFNNLLMVVKGNAELQMASNQVELEFLQEIHDAAQRGAALTRQLLTFARSTNPDLREFDLELCVKEFLPLLHRVASKRLFIEPGWSDQPLPIRGDPHQLEQVLLNLTLNAADASQVGSPLYISTGKRTWSNERPCRTGALENGDYACLEIRDSGCGMSHSQMDRLFEPFFTTKSEGNGLGLATAYGIVREHRGGIEVESQLGVGTMFRIYLPLRAVERPPDEPKTVEPASESTVDILLVEDLEHIRKIVSKILTTNGYRVLAFGTAHEAWEALEQKLAIPRLLISDVALNGESGLELAQRTRQFTSVPILLMSGYSQEAPVHQFPFLHKPFSAEELLQCVQGLLA